MYVPTLPVHSLSPAHRKILWRMVGSHLNMGVCQVWHTDACRWQALQKKPGKDFARWRFSRHECCPRLCAPSKRMQEVVGLGARPAPCSWICLHAFPHPQLQASDHQTFSCSCVAGAGPAPPCAVLHQQGIYRYFLSLSGFKVFAILFCFQQGVT